MASFAVSAAEVQIPDLLVSGDAQAGSKLVSSCAACHGANGQSISSDWPNLAGQTQRYIKEQLKYFQQGDRENVLMMAVIPYLKILSDTPDKAAIIAPTIITEEMALVTDISGV